MAGEPGGEQQPAGEPALARKVRGHVALGPDDLGALARLCRPEAVPRGGVLLDREHAPEAFLIERGWAMRFAILPNGRRQILGFALPGDTVGLSAVILGQSSESVAAITPLTASRLDAASLPAVLHDHPALGRAFLWGAARDHALLCDRLTSLGRRGAFERIARALLELTLRWSAVRDAAAGAVLPLTQPMLGDALGLSTVHVNRTFQRLRATGLVTANPMAIDDPTGLARLAKIEPGDPLHPLLEAWRATVTSAT